MLVKIKFIKLTLGIQRYCDIVEIIFYRLSLEIEHGKPKCLFADFRKEEVRNQVIDSTYKEPSRFTKKLID